LDTVFGIKIPELAQIGGLTALKKKAPKRAFGEPSPASLEVKQPIEEKLFGVLYAISIAYRCAYWAFT
jgi:hypothetical protein